MEHHIENLDSFIDANKISHFFLYGHSMGGYICTRFASNSKNFPFELPLSGLILESPLMLYSKIFEEISSKLKIPSAIRPFHLRRVFRDVRSMHPEHAQEVRLDRSTSLNGGCHPCQRSACKRRRTIDLDETIMMQLFQPSQKQFH